MTRALFIDTKAATLAEFATFASLAFTLCLMLYIGFSDAGRGVYADGQRDPELLSDTITENCLVRTRANDTVVPRQARPYNCFKLDEGNDRITVDDGDNIIYPGPGYNTIVINPGARDTQIVHQGGNDVVHFGGGASVIDLREYDIAEVNLSVARKTSATVEPGGIFDRNDRPAVDLLIRMPQSQVIVADHLANKPVSLILARDGRISGDDILQTAIANQSTDRSDRILGTNMLDIVSPGAGNDHVELFDGDDVITYTSGHDSYDPGPGRDILEIPSHSRRNVRFSVDQNGEDVIITIDRQGSIRLIGQLIYPPSGNRAQFVAIHFSDGPVRDVEIARRAVTDQGTPGDDTIYGTRYSDEIRPGTGVNLILPGTGSDVIHHEGGIDTIVHEPSDIHSQNILVIDDFRRGELSFVEGPDKDLVITTPIGSSIVVKGQLAAPVNTGGTNIDIFRLKGEDLSDDIMRKLFSLDDGIAKK